MRCSVVFGVTLRHFVINISSSSPAINTAAYYQRCVTTCATVAVVHRRPCWQHLACCSIKASRFLPSPTAFDTPLGGLRCSIAMPFGIEKLEWWVYPTVKKFWWYIYSFWHNSRTWRTHTQTDRQTDKQTDTQTDTAWRHRPRLCIASRGKNCKLLITLLNFCLRHSSEARSKYTAGGNSIINTKKP